MAVFLLTFNKFLNSSHTNPENYRILERFGLDGTLKTFYFQPPATGRVRRNNSSAPPEAIPVPGAVGAAQMEPNPSFGQRAPERAARNPRQGHSWHSWQGHSTGHSPCLFPASPAEPGFSPSPPHPAHQEVSSPPGVSLRCCPGVLPVPPGLQGRAQL